MGNLQSAVDVESGAASLEELRTYGGDMDSIVDLIAQLARNYAQFRGTLTDPTDVTFADDSLAIAIAENKPKIDALTPDEKQHVDAVMLGLGYSPTV